MSRGATTINNNKNSKEYVCCCCHSLYYAPDFVHILLTVQSIDSFLHTYNTFA
jgi:hypothetical protein